MLTICLILAALHCAIAKDTTAPIPQRDGSLRKLGFSHPPQVGPHVPPRALTEHHSVLQDLQSHPRAQLVKDTTSGAASSQAGGCPSLPIPFSLVSPFPTAPLAEVEALLSGLVGPDDTQAPGLAYALYYHGKPLLLDARGTADLATNRTVQPVTPFCIASVTKVFTAALTYVLASKALMSLDDPVIKYLPDFSVQDPFLNTNGSTITFRHLLSHGGGLMRSGPFDVSNEQAMAFLASSRMILPAGTAPSYSNMGFALLGHVLAKVAPQFGDTYDELLATLVLRPLNLTLTGTEYNATVLSELAVGYFPGGLAQGVFPMGWQMPAGGLYSTVADLSILLQDLAAAAAGAGSALGLPTGLAQELFQVVYTFADGEGMVGTPWEMLSQLPYIVRYKNGNLPGYTSQVSVVPDLRLSFALLTNGQYVNTWAAAVQVSNIIIPALMEVLQPLQPTPAPSPQAEEYVGTYVAYDGAAAVVVTAADGTGMLALQGPGYPLMPISWVSNDTFRVVLQAGAYSCMALFGGGMDGEWLDFFRTGNAVTSLTLPGLYGVVNWTRAN